MGKRGLKGEGDKGPVSFNDTEANNVIVTASRAVVRVPGVLTNNRKYASIVWEGKRHEGQKPRCKKNVKGV